VLVLPRTQWTRTRDGDIALTFIVDRLHPHAVPQTLGRQLKPFLQGLHIGMMTIWTWDQCEWLLYTENITAIHIYLTW
jgi:hypothetical protein